MLALHAPQLGVDVHQIHARRIVEKQRRLRQICQRDLQLAPLIRVQISGAKFVLIHARGGAQQARQQARRRHFEREHRHRLAHLRMRRHVLRDVQRQRRLAHRRPRRQDEQFAAVQPAGHFIELREAGAQAADALAGIEKRVDAAGKLSRSRRTAKSASRPRAPRPASAAILRRSTESRPAHPRRSGTGRSLSAR